MFYFWYASAFGSVRAAFGLDSHIECGNFACSLLTLKQSLALCAGNNVKEEGVPGQEGFSRSGRQISGSPECPESAPNAPSLAGSPTSATGAKRHTTNHSTPAKRTVKYAQPLQDMHPVLKLGYQTMCEVHCNGLQGLFLGGHDRDLYIQCTSHEYADLPLIDANQGGCIMSCSHFERAAGRELSKKWKESIHVVGEGEGSKATLLAWLKRQAEAMSPDIVGNHVWVCWCNEADFYHGTILSFNRESGKHKVCNRRPQKCFWVQRLPLHGAQQLGLF